MLRVTFTLPKPTRRRLIGTSAFCSAFSAVWLSAGSLPGADLSPKMLAAGLLVPFGVGAWSLVWAEHRVRVDSVPLRDDRPQRVFEPEALPEETVQVVQVVPR